LRHPVLFAVLAGGLIALTASGTGQEMQPGGRNGAPQQRSYQNTTPEQRAASTREFLGLGAQPDAAAAKRGEPVFQRNCAFCHGPQARGATGPNLITSNEVLDDDHGEHLVPFLKVGRPANGMPAFATIPDDQLKDVAEFLHVQVEAVANRGTYHVLNILVGDAAKGQTYVTARCMSCHSAESFAHIGSKFKSADQLQRGWIWPSRSGGNSLAITATVKSLDGKTIAGRVMQLSDFRIVVVDGGGETHTVDRRPGVEVVVHDPLAAHQEMIQTLTNEEMHNVTAYLESLR
jgi:cytochrome c oxidase cbb3-type subunit III